MASNTPDTSSTPAVLSEATNAHQPRRSVRIGEKRRALADPPTTPAPKRPKKLPYTRKPKIESSSHSLRLEADAMRALRATGDVTRAGQLNADGSPAPPYDERLSHETRDARVQCRYCCELVVLEGPFWRYGDRLEKHLRGCEEAKRRDEEEENENEDNGEAEKENEDLEKENEGEGQAKED